jgi:hypothetical protein
VTSRVTRRVCEKFAQNVVQPISGKNEYITFTEENLSQNFG